MSEINQRRRNRLSARITERGKRKKEIGITKELARRLQRKYLEFSIYANKCPSKSPKVKKVWAEVFHELCPPLQPEIDIIILEPPNPHVLPRMPKIRAIEIKLFKKINGRINQSFYKGIEQSLALLQWGFDNVALWQLFDESYTVDDIRNYGCKTWNYVHGLLNLPMDFTPIKLIGNQIETMRFQVIQANWMKNLSPEGLLDVDNPQFIIHWSYPNPLVSQQLRKERFIFTPQIGPRDKIVYLPGASKWLKEVDTLRRFLLDWLPTQRSGMND